ncbi:hypothetical protein LBMAG42_24710 [Deltaproteobacteria bacterium]|nr:hypothetical protein LBMAG42_24710 [Deltaproteobacteria bacterium]
MIFGRTLLPLMLLACADAAVVEGDKNNGGRDSGEDTGDTGQPVSLAGDYAGPVDGLYAWQGNKEACTGEATLTIAADYSFVGEAACTSATWGLLDGPLAGTVADGVVTGAWTVYFNPDTVDQELVGTVADGTFLVETEYSNSYGSFFSTITLALE